MQCRCIYGRKAVTAVGEFFDDERKGEEIQPAATVLFWYEERIQAFFRNYFEIAGSIGPGGWASTLKEMGWIFLLASRRNFNSVFFCSVESSKEITWTLHDLFVSECSRGRTSAAGFSDPSPPEVFHEDTVL